MEAEGACGSSVISNRLFETEAQARLSILTRPIRLEVIDDQASIMADLRSVVGVAGKCSIEADAVHISKKGEGSC